ncbi:hypothetical protein BTVI_98384 [Pitangus sulphuratus]|nr:hypothetical protein BTVI_98384 [Pitangus sulphuratus]
MQLILSTGVMKIQHCVKEIDSQELQGEHKPYFSLFRLCQFRANALSQVSELNVMLYTQMDADILLI